MGSLWSGSNKSVSTTPQQTEKLRSGIIDYLSNPQNQSGFSRIQFDPSTIAPPSQVGVQLAGPVSTAAWSGGNLNRGQVRDVTGQTTQSVDQLGGANSAFFQNMMAQLAPAFNQQRQLAAAQGSESAGNLTGSGFANRLGTNLNRTLGDQQALLANYATTGMQTEAQRQANDANRALAAGQGNQQSDLAFIQQLLSSRGQDLSARGQDIGVSTGNADRQQGAYTTQAQLDQQRQLQMYNNLFGAGQQNAQNFLQLLQGQGLAGVGPNDTIHSAGVIPTIIGAGTQLGGAYLGGK